MPVRYEHIQTIRATPDRVFAVLDDLPRTSQWLPPCVSLEKLGPGPNAAGDQLRYVYREGKREKEMRGEIVARVPGERLHCVYRDSAFDVSVDLRVAAAREGTRTTHCIEITPRTLLGRLFSPLIQLGLRNQTTEAATNLARLLEGTAA